MLKIEFDNLEVDPPGTVVSGRIAAYINIQADLRIHIDGRLFFDEPAVCVVELADQVRAWISSGAPRFRYDSMDEEEPDLLLLGVEGDAVKFFSARQRFSASQPLDRTQALAALNGFVEEVERRCRRDLGLAAGQWMTGSYRAE